MLDFDAGIGGPGCEQLDRLLHVLSSHVGVPLQKSCSGAVLTSFSTYFSLHFLNCYFRLLAEVKRVTLTHYLIYVFPVQQHLVK